MKNERKIAMKFETIQLRCDADRYDALRVALELKGTSIEAELANTFDALFEKNVHKAVQEFLLLKACTRKQPRPRPAGSKAGNET
jgi:hypothetical protein